MKKFLRDPRSLQQERPAQRAKELTRPIIGGKAPYVAFTSATFARRMVHRTERHFARQFIEQELIDTEMVSVNSVVIYNGQLNGKAPKPCQGCYRHCCGKPCNCLAKQVKRAKVGSVTVTGGKIIIN